MGLGVTIRKKQGMSPEEGGPYDGRLLCARELTLLPALSNGDHLLIFFW
jgi:hypothetical protein